MSRTKRTLAWSSACLVGLIALLTLAVALAISTTTGSRFVIAQIAQLLDDQLIIADIEGTISGPLTIHRLQFNSADVNVELERVDLDWSPGALLFSSALVHIENIELHGLSIVQLERESTTSTEPAAGVPDGITLPVDIRIDQFALDNGTLATRAAGSKEQAELFSVQSVQADNLFWDGDGIDIPQLALKTSFIDLTAKAQVRPEGNWPLHLDARYTLDLRAQQLPNLDGATVLSGSLEQIEIVQQIALPYAVRVEASLSDLLIAPLWQANLQATKLQLGAFGENLPATELTAKLTARGDTTEANLEGELQVSQSSVQLSGNVGFAEQFSDSPSVDLQLAWQNLTWPLDAKDNYLFASGGGNAQLNGVWDAYRASVNAQVAVPAYPSGNLEIAGTGSLQGFAVEQLALSLLGGNIKGDGSIDWVDELETTFDLAGVDLDPAGLDPDWPGRLSFTLQGDAALSTSGPVSAQRVTLQNLTLEGVLRDAPINATLTGRLSESGLTIPSLMLQILDSTFQAQGTIATTATLPMDFQWQFSADDLGLWTSALTGKAQAEGRLSGTVDNPRIQTSMTVKDILVAQVQIHHAELTADMGLGTEPLSLNANLDGLLLGETEIGSVELDLSGTLAQHILGLNMEGVGGTNQLTLSGSLAGIPALGATAPLDQWSNTAWQFSLEELDIHQGDIAIDLIQTDEATSTGRIDAKTISINKTCFSLADARLPQETADTTRRICAQATGTYTDEVTSNISFTSLPLMMLNPLLPEAMALVGGLNGSISLGWNMTTNAPRVNILLDTNTTDLQTKNSQGDVQTLLHFAPGKLSANWTNDAMFADIDLPLTGDAGLKATATLAPAQGGEFTTRALDANVVAKFDDLDWMTDFVPRFTQLRGELQSNVHVSGTLAGPNLTGRLSLKNGRAVLPEPGLTLRALNIDVVGESDNSLALTGSVNSGGGTLSVQGEITDMGPDMTGQIAVSGQRVLVLNTPEAEIYASPSINADLGRAHVTLTGKVGIDKADIQLASLPQTAATISDDQIIVATDTPVTAPGNAFNLTTRLRLLLNDAVSFSGFGLQAKFGGDLNLEGLPRKATTATGEIEAVEGHYQAYGQDLTIETGKLLFAGGPIDQPGIDVRAVRQATPEIKVGVLARGNLSAPEFSIFSEPAMNQSDQLAYLVLGRPLETSSASESSMLSRAALALGIKGGNYLTEQFGSRLGVDKIGIETPAGAANEQAALVVGKYLSPKLFVSYGVGILDAVGTLKIEYLLSSKWRLTSESSADQGGLDLTYVLER